MTGAAPRIPMVRSQDEIASFRQAPVKKTDWVPQPVKPCENKITG